MRDARTLSETFVARLRQVLGDATPVALHEPEFRGNEWAYVKECIDTGWVSSVGKFVDTFEAKLAEITGARHAVAIVNGTAALEVALRLVGVRQGDEVMTPALTFVGTANAVVHCGGVPHFVDSDAATLGMDPTALESHLDRIAERTAEGWRNRDTGRRIAAILPMHAFGHPVDLDGLMRVASRYALPIVEDAAESIGSTYHGRHTGTFGKVGVLSFNGNKTVTTGGGGAILTDDAGLARLGKHLTTTAKQPHKWEFIHDAVAWNYRLPNINAALGCAQLERLGDFVRRKRRLAEQYAHAFEGVEGVSFVAEPPGTHSNYWLCALRLRSIDLEARDALLAAANDAGYHCRPIWTLMHKLPMYRDNPRADLAVAQSLEASIINLPSSAALADAGARASAAAVGGAR